MKTFHKLLLIKSWGFSESYPGIGRYTKQGPAGYLQVWSTNNPDTIFFYDKDQFSHETKLNWELYSSVTEKFQLVEIK